MRAFLVRLPSGTRYWTVLDDELAIVNVADGFLRHVRFGRDWQAGAEQLGLFMTWLSHDSSISPASDDEDHVGVVLASH